MDPILLIAPVATFFLLAAAPGPATLSVAVTAMAKGARAALALSLGLAISLAAWGAVAAAGLGPLMLAWAPGLAFVKIAGGLVLLYLAWGAAKSALSETQAAPPVGAASTDLGWFLRGLLLNGLNPKGLIAWGAVVALGAGGGGASVWGVWLVCSIIGLMIYGSFSLLFAVPAARAGYARGRRLIDGVAAALFGAMGVRLLTWRADAP